MAQNKAIACLLLVVLVGVSAAPDQLPCTDACVEATKGSSLVQKEARRERGEGLEEEDEMGTTKLEAKVMELQEALRKKSETMAEMHSAHRQEITAKQQKITAQQQEITELHEGAKKSFPASQTNSVDALGVDESTEQPTALIEEVNEEEEEDEEGAMEDQKAELLLLSEGGRKEGGLTSQTLAANRSVAFGGRGGRRRRYNVAHHYGFTYSEAYALRNWLNSNYRSKNKWAASSVQSGYLTATFPQYQNWARFESNGASQSRFAGHKVMSFGTSGDSWRLTLVVQGS